MMSYRCPILWWRKRTGVEKAKRCGSYNSPFFTFNGTLLPIPVKSLFVPIIMIHIAILIMFPEK